METVIEVLRPTGIDAEAEGLDPFYESVGRRVQGASSPEACQAILIELYDKFFHKAFPRVTERLGTVYTPVEIVDFILHSVQAVLGEEFGSALGAPRRAYPRPLHRDRDLHCPDDAVGVAHAGADHPEVRP